MSQFCGCLGSTKPEPRTQIPAYPDAGFMPRPEAQMALDMHHQPPQYDSVDSGYSPVVPLPRYTPRPMSIHEKTLENSNQRSPSRGYGLDEKNRQDFEDSENAVLQSQSTGSSCATVTAASTTAPTTIMDDASSAYSFPSSFGHTSTETRETLPPPYSSCASSFYARSRASSVRSHRRSESLFDYSLNTGNASEGVAPPPAAAAAAIIAPPPMAHVQMSHQHHHYPSASISHPRQATSPNQRRLSWESR